MSKEIRNKLDRVLSSRPSNWKLKAEERRQNKGWLNLSAQIAITILDTLRAKGISQIQLAKDLGVSPQQVNKIVKGKENLTLQTINKIQEILEVNLITIGSEVKSKNDKDIVIDRLAAFETILADQLNKIKDSIFIHENKFKNSNNKNSSNWIEITNTNLIIKNDVKYQSDTYQQLWVNEGQAPYDKKIKKSWINDFIAQS